MRKVLSLVLVILVVLSLDACSKNEAETSVTEIESVTIATERDIEKEVSNEAKYYAESLCIVKFDDIKRVDARCTTVRDNGDNTYTVLGKVSIRDGYGDNYECKFDTIVVLYDSGEVKCKGTEFHLGELIKK